MQQSNHLQDLDQLEDDDGFELVESAEGRQPNGSLHLAMRFHTGMLLHVPQEPMLSEDALFIAQQEQALEREQLAADGIDWLDGQEPLADSSRFAELFSIQAQDDGFRKPQKLRAWNRMMKTKGGVSERAAR